MKIREWKILNREDAFKRTQHMERNTIHTKSDIFQPHGGLFQSIESCMFTVVTAVAYSSVVFCNSCVIPTFNLSLSLEASIYWNSSLG